MTFDRSIVALRETMLTYEYLRPKFTVKDQPSPPAPKRALCLENDIHLTKAFTSQYLSCLHVH